MADSAKPSRDQVTEWLLLLAIRCVPRSKAEDIEVICRTYAAPLSDDIPARAFCDNCLETVSRQHEFFPAYAALRKSLDKWLDRNPDRKAIVGPYVDLPAADHSMVIFWQEYRSGEKQLPRGVSLESWLDTFRISTPAAIRYICQTDTVAAEIAVRRGWFRERVDPTAEDIEAVHEAVQAFKAGAIQIEPDRARAGRQQAAEERALHQPSTVPPDQAPNRMADEPLSAAERFEARHGRKPGSVSPEVLAQLRADNPVLRKLAERQAAEAVEQRLQAANDAARPLRPAMPWDDEP